MKLHYNSTDAPNGYDISCPFEVTFDEEFSLKEFLQYIQAERKEGWGDIFLNAIEARNNPKNHLCQYGLGALGQFTECNQELFDAHAHKTVLAIQALGGGSPYMNYYVFTEPREYVEMKERVEKLEWELQNANDKVKGWQVIVQTQRKEIAALKAENKRLQPRKHHK